MQERTCRPVCRSASVLAVDAVAGACQPYEVSSYAYGAPTITIPWAKLDAIKAATQGDVRYGF